MGVESRSGQSGMLHSLKAVMDVNGNGLTLMSNKNLEATSAKTVRRKNHHFTKTHHFLRVKLMKRRGEEFSDGNLSCL